MCSLVVSEFFFPGILTNLLYNASRGATHTIVDSISNAQHFDLDVHDDVVASAYSDYQRVCDILFNTLFFEISFKLDPLHLHSREQEVMISLASFLLCP